MLKKLLDRLFFVSSRLAELQVRRIDIRLIGHDRFLTRDAGGETGPTRAPSGDARRADLVAAVVTGSPCYAEDSVSAICCAASTTKRSAVAIVSSVATQASTSSTSSRRHGIRVMQWLDVIAAGSHVSRPVP